MFELENPDVKIDKCNYNLGYSFWILKTKILFVSIRPFLPTKVNLKYISIWQLINEGTEELTTDKSGVSVFRKSTIPYRL